MKFISFLCLYFFSFSFSVFALTGLDSHWTPSYEYEHIFRCEKAEASLCRTICNNETECRVVENYCHNCVGTDLYLRKLFLEMGTTYASTGALVSLDELGRFIKSGNFISLNSKSIYNFVDSFDAANVRMRFQMLCDFQNDYPLVFLETSKSRFPGKVRYVVCQNEKMEIFSLQEENIILRP